MELIINDDNLGVSEIQEFNSKVRALLLDENNNILIANYGNIILFPGGSIDSNETINEAILRELKEETGIDYSIGELEYLTTLKYYQKDYLKRDGNVLNRLITTNYFVGKCKGIGKSKLTEKEQNDNFRLELVPIDNLEELVLKYQTNNPRKNFFEKELIIILEYYKHTYSKMLIKKINVNQ